MTTTELRVTDPAAAVSRLAASGLFGDYVGYERQGEWIFAADPVATVVLDTESVTVATGHGRVAEPWRDRPFAALRRGVERAAAAGTGCYGWVGFAAGACEFGIDPELPARTVLAQFIVPRVEIRIGSAAVDVRGLADDEHAAVAALLTEPDAPTPAPVAADTRCDDSDYRGRTAAAIAEIRAGRYQKVILSRRVDVPFRLDMPATYRLGRAHNTPARSFLLRLGELEAVGFSPELVAAVDEAGIVTTEPLAGTRAFGRGAHLDRLARAELESDPKEIVEHAVSVKTSMTEMASIAEPGTPAVEDFMTVRCRGSVQHLASTVRGTLAPGRTGWDALAALFPAVTASGIPKRESMQAIIRLDHSARGLYSGAVVAVSDAGALEASLVLRAVYQTAEQTWLRAGAGIIGQSRPDREFEETCEKLASVAPYLVPADPARARSVRQEEDFVA